jgi:hypothetical protein
MRDQQRLVFVGIGALLASCASSGALRVTMPLTVGLDPGRRLVLRVESIVPEAGKALAELEKLTINRLRPILPNVLTAAASTEPADYVLRARIVSLDKVGGGARFFFGGLAGRAGVVVDCELLDGKQGTRLGGFVAEGRSSGGTIFAGTTLQALELASDQIATFVRSAMKGQAPRPAAVGVGAPSAARSEGPGCDGGDAEACLQAALQRHAAGQTGPARTLFERAYRMGLGKGCAAVAELVQASADRMAAIPWWQRACAAGYRPACARDGTK